MRLYDTVRPGYEALCDTVGGLGMRLSGRPGYESICDTVRPRDEAICDTVGGLENEAIARLHNGKPLRLL